MSKQTICLDFDGVLNTYDGWKGEEMLFDPRPGVREFLGMLAADYKLVIHSTRSAEKIQKWLERFDLAEFIDSVTDVKPPAMVYLDDRAVRFDGNLTSALWAIDRAITEGTHWEGKPKSRPTIAELEAILAADDTRAIEI